MKGYVYLNSDDELEVRAKSYVDSEDPGFYGRNRASITCWMEFDSSDLDSMTRILSAFKGREIQRKKVADFCKAVNFDLDEFLKNRKNENNLFPK